MPNDDEAWKEERLRKEREEVDRILLGIMFNTTKLNGPTQDTVRLKEIITDITKAFRILNQRV